jgi:hypothetical protein
MQCGGTCRVQQCRGAAAWWCGQAGAGVLGAARFGWSGSGAIWPGRAQPGRREAGLSGRVGDTRLRGRDSVRFGIPGLGAGGRLYRSTDGGRRWIVATPVPAGYPAMMIVQCAGAGSAWALAAGELGTMEKQPYVGYRAGPAGAEPIFADQYFPQPGVLTPGPGPYAGPFSAISSSAAVFAGSCEACGPGPGTVPWDLVTGSGAVLAPEGNVAGLNVPEAASFVSPQLGWVIGMVFSTPGTGSPLQRIVFTDDGGRSWHVQYTGPAAP